ncbi:MAG: SGNH family hydrolase [Pseudomonadota bacterium]
MLRKLSLFLVILLGVAIAMPQISYVKHFFGVETAQAQTKKRKRKTLFDVLFKRRNKKKRSTRQKVTRRNLQELPGVNRFRQKRKTTTNNKKRRIAPAAPQVVVVKSENAAKILVIGDFMGSAVANGLKRLYSDNPNIVIINKAHSASGVVRNDVLDWAEVTDDLINDVKPVAVVNLTGMNDRQQMRFETGRVEKFSEDWLLEYNTRVEKIVAAGTATSTPMVWVGIPPVRSGSMNADYLKLNELFRSKVEVADFTYVDVWDGFTNAEGKFVSAGPDINGQIVRLRGSKGVTMTRAGRQKLAFFVDKELKRLGLVSDGAGAQFASLGTFKRGNAQPQVPEYDPVGTGKTVVISLGSPISDGGNELEGEEGFLKPGAAEKSVSFALVENGVSQNPQVGRIDSGWGLPKKPKSKTSDTSLSLTTLKDIP